MAAEPAKVGGIVLCGGRSTRMGRPKLALPFGGQTMLERVVEVLAGVVSPVAVVAAPRQSLPELPPEVIVARDEQEDRGPLAGLAAGLAAIREQADAAYLSSCDVPLLKGRFVHRMIGALDGHQLAVPRDGKYYHPLAAVYRVSLEEKVRTLMAENRMRPYFLIEECDAAVVEVETLREVDSELDSLRNVNTPEEYRAALRSAGLEGPA